VKRKIELPTIKLQVQFPIWILKVFIYDRLTTLLRTVVVCGLILRDIKHLIVVGERKTNPILPRCKSFFTIYWQTDERIFSW